MPNFKAANNPDANSGYGDPWTPEGKERLYELRQQYKLPWQEFQERFYPKRSMRSLQQTYSVLKIQKENDAAARAQTTLNRPTKHNLNYKPPPAKRTRRTVAEDESPTGTERSEESGESEDSDDEEVRDIQPSGQKTLNTVSLYHNRDLASPSLGTEINEAGMRTRRGSVQENRDVANETKTVSPNRPRQSKVPVRAYTSSTDVSSSAAGDRSVSVAIPTANSNPSPATEMKTQSLDGQQSSKSLLTVDDLKRCEDGIWESFMKHASIVTKNAANYKTEKARADAAVASEQKAIKDAEEAAEKYKEQLGHLQDRLQRQNSMIEKQTSELDEVKQANEALKKDFEDFQKRNATAIQQAQEGDSRCETCSKKDDELKAASGAGNSIRDLNVLFLTLHEKCDEMRTHLENTIHPNIWKAGPLPALWDEIERCFRGVGENMSSIRSGGQSQASDWMISSCKSRKA
ncbi:hypothetical protein VTN00DRAFT_10105 [Thermoascus crustaceus]|uniref:uncharacterized protein n=1 Tax=Thermoascus crustaceus TaxID=5088 RepID=UPI00374217F3